MYLQKAGIHLTVMYVSLLRKEQHPDRCIYCAKEGSLSMMRWAQGLYVRRCEVVRQGSLDDGSCDPRDEWTQENYTVMVVAQKD